MSKPSKAREGNPLRVRELEVQYSFWPAKKTTRWKLQRRLFVRDPWAILCEAVYRNRSSFLTPSARDEGLSYIEQAEEYFNAARGAQRSVKPVLLYYSMLNLAKCIIKARDPALDLSRARHGLVATPTRERAILMDQVSVKTSLKYVNVFGKLLEAIETGKGPSFQSLEVRDLLPQIVPGHRLWTYASEKTEKFLALADLKCFVDPAEQRVWLRLTIDRGEVRHILQSVQRLIKTSHLPGRWHQVTVDPPDNRLIILEQDKAVHYQQRPIDPLQGLFQSLRPALWCTVTSSAPYRQYYLFVDSHLGKKRLPQWAAVYVLFFYLADLTRYRPQLFDRFIASKYGPQIESVLDECPRQFLYMMASELLQRDVASPAITS